MTILKAEPLPPFTKLGFRRNASSHRRSVVSRSSSSDASATSSGCDENEDVSGKEAWRSLQLDWGRRHLQILFVDEGHGCLARGAEGVCQRVANWAGAGHMLFPSSAGMSVDETVGADAGATADGLDASFRLLQQLQPLCESRYATSLHEVGRLGPACAADPGFKNSPDATQTNKDEREAQDSLCPVLLAGSFIQPNSGRCWNQHPNNGSSPTRRRPPQTSSSRWAPEREMPPRLERRALGSSTYG